MDKGTKLAKERTDWAEDRTVLANERTFAGWLRTGMTAIVVAIGLQAVFDEVQPPWVPKAIATCFILLAIFVFQMARQAACAAQRRLDDHATDSQGTGRINAIATALSVAAAAAGLLLWLL